MKPSFEHHSPVIMMVVSCRIASRVEVSDQFFDFVGYGNVIPRSNTVEWFFFKSRSQSSRSKKTLDGTRSNLVEMFFLGQTWAKCFSSVELNRFSLVKQSKHRELGSSLSKYTESVSKRTKRHFLVESVET